MSTQCALYRFPKGETAEGIDLSEHPVPQSRGKGPIPLGPLATITERLRASGRFREDRGADRATDMALRMLRHEGGEVPAAAWHNAALRCVETDAEIALFGDPVEAIHLNRGAATDLLTVVDVLEDLGPFAVRKPDDGRLVDPREL